MITSIALSLLGAWNYAGFADEPTPRRPPAPRPTPPPATSAEPAGPPLLPRVPAPTPAAVAPPARPVAAAPIAPPPPPSPVVRYRLVDGCGQIWEHPDPAYLSAWVNARNQAGGSCRRPAVNRLRP